MNKIEEFMIKFVKHLRETHNLVIIVFILAFATVIGYLSIVGSGDNITGLSFFDIQNSDGGKFLLALLLLIGLFFVLRRRK